MRSGSRRAALVGASAAAGLLVVLLGAWAIDETLHSGKVPRNVTLAGQPVGGLAESDLRGVVGARAESLVGRAVVIQTPAGAFDQTVGGTGMSVDEDATVESVLTSRDGGSAPTRPFRWFAGLFGTVAVDPVLVMDRASATESMSPVITANLTEPVEPVLVAGAETFSVEPGVPGKTLDLDQLEAGMRASAIEALANDGDEPLTVEVSTVALAPSFDDSEMQELAGRAEELSSRPLTVVVGGRSTVVPPATLRTWMRAVPDADRTLLNLEVDLAAVETDVTRAVGQVGNPPVDVTWTVGPDGVAFSGGTSGTGCCAPDSAERVVEALEQGTGRVELDLTTVQPTRDAAWARSMRIVEPIATFTTNHACCENRVRNIHRMAEMVRGVVVAPGETFSLNGHVGPRTAAKGFVPAGVIYDGRFEQDYGGGVSQFATTLFNAAFFGGMEFEEYQAHTIYISRYPYGREATVSHPAPDLAITNVSPYGILIWPTWTGTSITVTLYSTRWVDAQQTGQRTEPRGRCTRVITERTRTRIDTGEVQVDTVSATYQPAEGVLC